MNDPSVPNGSHGAGSHGAEGDSEKKKWGYKREQFDAVITNTRLNGAIDRLISGTVEVKALLAVLDELNGSSQQGRYMAEMLALKKESRRVATAAFSPAVAQFLIEGSRRIPVLSDGLASQMAVTLASAADNLEYLDTVNAAVGNLLLDLDHPLRPDTRNYLRALTDKIDATRRLQQARSHLATIPSVYPPASESGGQASTPKPQRVIAVGEASPVSAPTPAATYANTEPLPRFSEPSIDRNEFSPELASVPLGSVPLGSAPGVALAPPIGADFVEDEEATRVRQPPAPVQAETPESSLAHVPSDPSRTVPGIGAPVVGSNGAPASTRDVPPQSLAKPSRKTKTQSKSQSPSSVLSGEEPYRIPTKGFPWGLALGTLGALSAAGIGIQLWLGSKSDTTAVPEVTAVPAASSASTSRGTLPAANAKTPTSMPQPGVTKPPSATASVVPPPPPPVVPPPLQPPPQVAPQVQPKPLIREVPRVVSPSNTGANVSHPRSSGNTSQRSHVNSTPVVIAPPTTKPLPEPKPQATAKPAETADPGAPSLPRTPTPTRDIDQILAELRQVPGDAGHIEAKAYEVARIIARSAKPEAEHIIGRLTPEELLFGTEAYDTRALEPLRRVVALLLKKVAVDKDDARAAMAIEMLGDWAESRKHGAAAKLTLDQLSEESVVLSRPKRRLALARVQARLGTFPEPTE